MFDNLSDGILDYVNVSRRTFASAPAPAPARARARKDGMEIFLGGGDGDFKRPEAKKTLPHRFVQNSSNSILLFFLLNIIDHARIGHSMPPKKMKTKKQRKGKRKQAKRKK